MGVSLSRDTRDSVFEPTRGSNSSVGADFAGIGFGDQWFRVSASTSYFHPTPWLDHVIGVRVSGAYALGWGNDPVPLFERFFLGGANSIRSFKAQQISPQDSTGTRIGGNIQLLGNIEYTVPLLLRHPGRRLLRRRQCLGSGHLPMGLKFDITDLKQAIGLGVRWVSPFGPIRVDYGVNPNPKKGEDFGAFSFSVGSAF